MRTILVTTALLAASVTMSAQESRPAIDVSTLGPQVGESIPAFTLPDQRGEVWTEESILGPEGALILFHRSADW